MAEILPSALQLTDADFVRAAFGGLNLALVTFLCVVTRLTGLFLVSPVLGHPEIPAQLRLLAVVAMSLVLTPVIGGLDISKSAGRLDSNRDGWIEEGEIPPELEPEFSALRVRLRLAETSPIPVSAVSWSLSVPETPLQLIRQLFGELAIGFGLGLGVLIWISAMQFAGHLIDQQTGVSLGELFNPELGSTSTLSGELLHWLGLTAFLAAGGHLLVVRSLVESYEALPLGHAWVPQTLFTLFSTLVTQSLLLAVQIAAPVGIVMAAVGLAMGFMGHAIPQINVLIIGFPVRTLTGFVVLMVAFSRMTEALMRDFTEVLRQFLTACGGG